MKISVLKSILSDLSMLCYAKSLQSCPTLCDPIDGSLPGSPVPGILQVRTLEWVAISFSNAWKWKVKSEREVAQSCPTLSDPMDCSLPGSSVHGIFQARVLEWGAIAFSGSTYRYPHYLLHCICMEYILPSPHFQFMCVLKTEVLRQNIVGSFFVCLLLFLIGG